MPALTLLIIAFLCFAIAYRFYSKFIIAKVLVTEELRKTPAYDLRDGRDYHPTNKWVLFGHHFAAISGAGPLVGPVLAAQFGYLPGFLWLLIGAVLGGAVHDVVILFASIRYKGLSLTKIAQGEVGRTTAVATGFAILFIIVTALAGLALVVVNALAESAWATFTIACTIPTALFVGLYMYRIRPGKIAEASAIGVIMVLAGVIIGEPLARSGLAHYFVFSRQTLSVMLPLYGFAASVLPVWMLLCPRDYLSSYMKIGTVLLLAAGIFAVNPVLQMPAVTSFINGGGPIIPGKVWPFVCITIACGAISGFHSLISSGTTPKMINSESDVRFIGYGAMLLESAVALMALIAACVLAPGDYFAINAAPAVFEKLGLATVNLNELSRMTGETLAGRTGGAVSLAVGMAHIFSSIPGMKYLMAYWYHFAIMFEALFILTTVDTGTRVARYIIQELLAPVYKPLGSGTYVPAVLLTSALTSLLWGYLVYNGDVSTIWPMFGVANQLLATLALAIGTVFILRHSTKKSYALITFIPMCFMLVTTVTAGVQTIFYNYLPRGTAQGNLNAALSAIMMILVFIISVDSVREMIAVATCRSPRAAAHAAAVAGAED
jgi:carbon starvation protein